MLTRSSCTSILIGKNATFDHSVIIGRNEDSKAAWPKHIVKHAPVVDAQQFASKANKFAMPLPKNALAYTATPEWTDKFGLFEEAGINSAGVAMSATESAYANMRVLAYDPFIEDGITEEAMVTVVLPYVKSAREGVQRLADIVEKYGTGEATAFCLPIMMKLGIWKLPPAIVTSRNAFLTTVMPWSLINSRFKWSILTAMTLCTVRTSKISPKVTNYGRLAPTLTSAKFSARIPALIALTTRPGCGTVNVA